MLHGEDLLAGELESVSSEGVVAGIGDGDDQDPRPGVPDVMRLDRREGQGPEDTLRPLHADRICQSVQDGRERLHSGALYRRFLTASNPQPRPGVRRSVERVAR